MSPRTKAQPRPEPAPTRSEDRLRVVRVDADGTIHMELIHRARTYWTEIPADGSVTMIEAAALCGCTRSTVYNWAKPRESRWSHQTPAAPLKVALGRVELPELRRFLRALGRWWLTDHPAAERIANAGPVAGGDE